MQKSIIKWAQALTFMFAFMPINVASLPVQGVDENEPALRGFVCDINGNPLSCASILVNMHLKLEAGKDGNFAVPASQLKPSKTPVLLLAQAEKDAKQLRCARFVDYITGKENVSLPLKEAAKIQGLVLSSDGKPVAGAKVLPYIDVGALTCTGHSVLSVSSTTDVQGNFTLTNLYPDTRYMLRLRAPGFERKWSDWIPVGKQQLCPSLEIVLYNAPGFIAGRVVNTEGKPIAKTRVVLGHLCMPDDIGITDKNGHFKFVDLVPGKKYSIWAARKSVKDVPVGTENLTITAEQSGK